MVQENEAGNPCHEGVEETAPIGSYTCNPNVSICIEKWVGPNYGITSFDNIWLAMLTVFQVRSPFLSIRSLLLDSLESPLSLFGVSGTLLQNDHSNLLKMQRPKGI